MTMRWFLPVALASGLALAGCGDDDDGDGGAAAPPPQQPQTCTPPTTPTATFSGAVHPILTSKCTPCHADSFGSSNVATSFAAARARVDVTSPAQSTLIRKGDAQVAHGGGDRLDPADVTTLTTWVTECAQNN
jgi:hypothetical protein